MGNVTVSKLYHIGIPVNDMKRAEKFYQEVLGMKLRARGKGERETNRPFFEALGYEMPPTVPFPTTWLERTSSSPAPVRWGSWPFPYAASLEPGTS